MKKITTLLFALSISIAAFAQTYPIGRMNINFKDGSRTGGFSIAGAIQMPGTGRDIGTDIYYPAVSAGTNVAVASGTFPVVVFGHGFVMNPDDYDNISNALAAKGYIVALPRTEGSAGAVHSDFGADLRFLSSQILAFNSISTPSSVVVFNNKVLQKASIGGHSMGGGCSFLAAANNSTLACLFNMAAANSNTAGVSSIQSASLVTIPTLVISGQRDCVADTTVHQNPMYNGTASAIKFKVILKDITHCDFGDGGSFACTFGQGTSGCGNTISNAAATNRYMTYLEPFLAKLLKSDCAKGQQFMDTIQATSSVRVGRRIQGTLVCITTTEPQLDNIAYLSIYPNPSHSIVNIDMNLIRNNDTKIVITNQLGQVVFSETKNSESQQLKMPVNCEAWSNGIYFITITAGEKAVVQKFVKL
jgi:dienelactone hydrolase